MLFVSWLEIIPLFPKNELQDSIEVIGTVELDLNLASRVAAHMQAYIRLQVSAKIVFNSADRWIACRGSRLTRPARGFALSRTRLVAEFADALLEFANT
jgi:hypothetical protein